ncbi:MAG: pyridoxal phosphate-dependent aminotransferase, partial [Gemmatimonadota bacterium]
MTDTTPDTAFKPSRNLEHLEPSATLAISQEAQRRRTAGEDVVNLSAGEPDFETPRIVSEAGVRAIQQGKTHYPPNAGILDLRAAAARQLSLLSGGRPVNADNIIVSSGAKQSVFNACFVLFSTGDEVLIPSPYWVSYPQMVYLARAKPVVVPGHVDWSLKVGVDQLDKAANAQTKGLILCTPSNPTGAVYTRSELKAIVGWAKERDIWVISDEVYRRIHYGSGPAPSVLDLSDDHLERVVLVSGASKSYAMTGWRIGFALAPRPVVKAMAAFQSHVTSGASHPAQWAAAAAYSDERVEADAERMVNEFRQRRDLVVSHFRDRMPGVEFVDPLGAFYFFFRVDNFFDREMNSALKFCERLLAERGVA